jgi:hypothetical protein
MWRPRHKMMLIGLSAMFTSQAVAGGFSSGCIIVQESARPINRQREGVASITKDKTTRAESGVMIEHPNTLLDLLSNLKFAFDNNLLLQADFYTEDRLAAFSGGKEVHWLQASETRRWVEISGFGGIADPMQVGSTTYSGISYRGGRVLTDDGKVQASAFLQLTGHNPSVSFTNMERIFGQTWEADPYFPPPKGRIFQPPTDVHGNQRIRYTSADADVTRVIVLEFQADGTLYEVSLEEKTK